MEYSGDKGASDFQSTFRTELLTAEASDTLFSVDFRFFIFDNYSLGGAYARAYTATDAHIGLQDRTGS